MTFSHSRVKCLQHVGSSGCRALSRAAVLAAACLAALVVALPATASGPQSVAPVAEKLIDAVVNISTAQKVKGSSGRPLPNVPKGSPFEDLFEDFFDKDEDSTGRKVNSLGSGFVIDGIDGLIVTNNHVIEGSDEITIIFHDGRKLKVDKVLGVDAKTDLALLKVTPDRPLPSVRFGSSETTKVGDWVLAIGNPFGLGGSVSVGIISAKQRDIRSGPYDDYLQTDAAINKGNSGGPLFNMDGDVVGVNTAIISPSGGSIGIGFAVPSDTALLVVDQLRKFGETRRGWLGVNIQSVTEDIARSLNVEPNSGALIASVTPDGPAAKAGIEPGDVVVAFDGKPITSMRALPRLVARTEEGAVVNLEVLRKTERLRKTVTVGRLQESKPETPAGAEPQPDTGPVEEGPLLGLVVEAITPDLVQQFDLKDDIEGLVVTAVEGDSTAEKRGIAVGEVIAEAGGVRVASRAALAEQIEKVKVAKRKSILLRILKNDGSFRFVALPVE